MYILRSIFIQQLLIVTEYHFHSPNGMEYLESSFVGSEHPTLKFEVPRPVSLFQSFPPLESFCRVAAFLLDAEVIEGVETMEDL